MADEATPRSRVGRPANINVAPEDAAIVREAVKVAARYFGFKLQDLGPESWITAAMRKKAPMSVTTALALVEFISHPQPQLVGKKRPQGTSANAILRRFMDQVQETGSDPTPEDYASVKDDVGGRFLGYANFAALIMQKYRLPVPGTAVFVMPGTARIVASTLADLLPLENVGKQRRRDIVETLERYFALGEEPLETELGKKLVPRLTYLSLAHNLRSAARFRKTEGWQDEELQTLETWAKDVMRSEGRRGRAKRWGPLSKAPQANKTRTSK